MKTKTGLLVIKFVLWLLGKRGIVYNVRFEKGGINMNSNQKLLISHCAFGLAQEQFNGTS